MLLAAGFSVQVDDLRVTAARFAELAGESAAALATASGALAGTGGMAGGDGVLAPWRVRYDGVAAAQWRASSAAGAMLAAIARALTSTGDAYLAAEHAATPDAVGPPGRLPPAGDRDPGRPPPPPSATGPGGPAGPDALAAFYPGGDPARLRAAGAAWSGLARAQQDAGWGGDAAFAGLLAWGDGATFSAMRTFWSRQYAACAPTSGAPPLFTATALGASTLGGCCTQLADLIERTRASVLGAAQEAAADMSPLDLPATLLGRITWGVTELELFVGTVALAVSYLNDYRAGFLHDLDQLVDQLSPALEHDLITVAASPPPDDGRIADPAGVGVALADVAEIAGAAVTGTAWDAVAGDHPTPDSVHLTPQRIVHILDGDRKNTRSGGHRAGTGRRGKTEFPPTWSDRKILTAVLSVARDPTRVLPPKPDGNRELAGMVDGVTMVVIVSRSGEIITGHPLAGPGVVQNPP